MANKDNMRIYNEVRKVPTEAQRKITGGRLNGMTDINPMWRISELTRMFGPAGFGWRIGDIEQRLEPGANGEVMAVVNLSLYVKMDNEWSEAIIGTGGAMFIVNEKSGARTNDEAFKMATTDALSVACKLLGIGADVYWNAGSKYVGPITPEKPKQTEAKMDKAQVPVDDDLPNPKSANEKKAEAVDAKKLESARAVVAPDGRTLGEIVDANPEDLKAVANANKADKNLTGACVLLYNAWAKKNKPA